MTWIEFVEFPLDRSIVAPTIYQEWTRTGITRYEYVDQTHRVTPHGVRINRETTRELAQLLYQYSEFVGQPGRYCRADVYITHDTLEVLEVNMAFVDGWGTSLNLARAAGVAVDPPPFAPCFVLDDIKYRPELELLLRELGGNHHIHAEGGMCDGPVCLYGRRDPAIDDKRLLARFAAQWRGDRVHIPRFYMQEAGDEWDHIPHDVFLKSVDKHGSVARATGVSVRRGKPNGKSRFLRRAYRDGTLIAQAQVDGLGKGGQPHVPPAPDQDNPNPRIQLVVMAASQRYITGYMQYGGDLITDDSVHGPLQFDW